MGERRAPGRTRQSARARERRGERYFQERGALDQIGQRTRNDEDRKPKGKRDQDWSAAFGRERDRDPDHRQSRRAEEPLRNAQKVAALPRQQRSERNGEQQRNEQRPEGRVEERRPDRDLVAGQRLERERIKRSDKDRGAGAQQEQIVQNQRSFPRNRREQAPLLQERRAYRKQRKPATDEQHQDHQNEQAARRVGREGMDRGQDARAHQEGPDQRQREREDRQQDGPDLERVALLHHDGGVQQRGGGHPGHQRGVLNRVPEPPATPAQRVVGPIGSHRDAAGQKHPGKQRPGPHPTRPGSIDAAFDEGRDREGERDREPHIADVEQWRMDGEAGILQDWVEVAALDRRRLEAEEGIRGRQDEKVERERDPGLNRQHIGLEPRRQVGAEDRHQGAEDTEDENPQHHRAFMVSPHTSDLVDQRLRR